MSSDNYLALDKHKEHYYVWMVLGGYDNSDWDVEYQIRRGRAHEFDTFSEAIDYAQEWLSKEMIEYGLRILCRAPEFPKENWRRALDTVALRPQESFPKDSWIEYANKLENVIKELFENFDEATPKTLGFKEFQDFT